jgi:A/G-specific adenine glycosylase
MVSEFMLQQTRIETVLPYYDRFLYLFPTLPDLARAPLAKVLRVWSGLGYYARARNLHSAAAKILKDFAGKIPSTKPELLALPGFGPYTAGAVASIAFNESAAAVDGNVKRVLSRLSAIHGPMATPRQKKKLEGIHEELIPPGRASDFNQALMDLGAGICLPIRPKCSSCPVQKYCPFPRLGEKAAKRRPRTQRNEDWLIALIEKEGGFLMHRKEGSGLLGGLWQFPTIVFPEKGRSSLGKNEKTEKELLKIRMQKILGMKIKFRRALSPLPHSFTHIQAMMKPYLFSILQDGARPILPPQSRWVKLSNLSRYPVSRAMAKVSDLLKHPPIGIPAGKGTLSERGRGEK